MVASTSTDHVELAIHPTDTKGDGHRAVALVALVVTEAIAVASIVLLVVNRPQWHVGQWYFVVDLADAVVYGAVGWVLLSRVSRPVVWIVVGCAFGGAVAAWSLQWTELRGDHPDLPVVPLLTSAQNWAWIPGTLALILVAPWLVRSGPLDRLGRFGITIGSIVTVAHVLTRWTDPFPWPDGESTMPFAIRDRDWAAQVETVDQGFMWAILIVGLAAAADVARRWRSMSTPDSRRGLGWLAIGGALMTIAFAPLALPASWTADLPVATTPLLHLTSQLFFPGALLVAVLGQRLWGLQLAVSRAVAWSLLTAALIAGYVVLVSLLGLLLPGLTDDVERVAAAALVAAAIDPVRRFVQRKVDRLVHGDAHQPSLAVDRLVGHLGAAGDPQGLLSGVLEGIVESLRLGGGSIDMTAAGDPRVISVGTTDGHEDVVTPLVLDGELVGALSAWPRPGERLDQRTRRALEALVPTVAVAGLLAVKATELAESCTRLVTARDEERRAIRRELHDGLGPSLAGVGYAIEAARKLVVVDPGGADRLLARLAEEIDARVEEVRTLARELVPPVLVEAGLAPALVELVDRHRLSGLEIELVVDDRVDRVDLGTARENALYGIAAEAVRNVVRHANASTCSVSLRIEGDTVSLTVADDGIGIDGDTPSGVGLQSMRERATAIGADLAIGRGPVTGSVVAIRVPVRRGASA